MRLSRGWRRFQADMGKPPLRMLPPYITPARGRSLYDDQRTFGRWGVVVVTAAVALLYAVVLIVLHFKGAR